MDPRIDRERFLSLRVYEFNNCILPDPIPTLKLQIPDRFNVGQAAGGGGVGGLCFTSSGMLACGRSSSETSME